MIHVPLTFLALIALGAHYLLTEFTEAKDSKLATGYLEDGVDLRANLERIRRGEIEEWLRESREKYKCPVCGEPLSVSAVRRKCYHCGADLSKFV